MELYLRAKVDVSSYPKQGEGKEKTYNYDARE